MIDMEIHPLEGMSGLSFGQSRESVRALLGAPESFRRAAHSLLTDSYLYRSRDLYLGYDDEDLLHTIEVASPAPASLCGVRLLDRAHGEVLAELRAAGLSPVETSAGWAMPDLGIMLGNPQHEDPQGFQSILISSGIEVVHSFEFFEREGEGMSGDFEVVSNSGFGVVRLGATREEMRELLGGGIASVPDVGSALQDTFLSVGVVLGYDANERVTRAVLTGRASVSHRGIVLLGRPCVEVCAQARAKGVRVIEREAELVFPDDGFSAWTARVDNELPIAAVVMPAPRGYSVIQAGGSHGR
ncbi:hypothetical protein ACWD5V_36085 [Streptomyces sp. NPDC002523]